MVGHRSGPGMVEMRKSCSPYGNATIISNSIAQTLCWLTCSGSTVHHCVNVIECTYTNLDSIAYYTLRLYGIAYCS
jgi:hypothetical protein